MVSLPSSSISPWAGLADAPRLQVHPLTRPFSGSVAIPGSKSLTNRALLAAAAAKGTSTIRNILKSDDSYWCLEALQKLGVKVEISGADVQIIGTASLQATEPVYIGSAGTIGRFLPGLIMALLMGSDCEVHASEQLSGRPLGLLLTALKKWGGGFEGLGEADCYPLRIHPHQLTGGEVSLTGKVSSQFISGLMMAAPLCQNPTTILVTDPIVQQDYVALMRDVMAAFGVQVEHTENFDRISIQPQSYQPADYVVEADASTASYFAAAAAITGGEVALTNVGPSNTQPDMLFLNVLEEMGCQVSQQGEKTIIKGPKKLKGGQTFNFQPMSDTALTLGAIAPFADAPITVTNVAHIRKHESDRVKVMCSNMAQMGIQAEEYEDGFTIHPGTPKPAVLDTFDDHRVAMAFALTGWAGQGVTLKDPGCTSKTCPNYFDLMGELGGEINV